MSEILHWEERRTRKPHTCFGCEMTYPKGTKMVHSAVTDGGTVSSCYWCKTCQEYMSVYFESGDETEYGQIYANDPEGWEEIKVKLESEDR